MRVGCRANAPFDLRTGDNNDRFNIDSTRTPATLASWVNRQSWFGNGQANLNRHSASTDRTAFSCASA